MYVKANNIYVQTNNIYVQANIPDHVPRIPYVFPEGGILTRHIPVH